MSKRTIVHVEDNKLLAQVVQLSFESFGFKGEIIHSHSVSEAFALLAERECQKAPLDLILLDMQLPDGTGLDVLRVVKSSLTWQKTPVIIFSGENSPEVIREAYALGANCYLPKYQIDKKGRGSVHALYQCWLESALIPEMLFPDRAQEILVRGVRLRARTAQLYLELSASFDSTLEQATFWLERAMVEGNLSNLLAFFQGQLNDSEIPAELAQRFSEMQFKVEMALNQAERILLNDCRVQSSETSRYILDLLNAWDEELFAYAFEALFPKNPIVAMALKSRAANQIKNLASFVLEHSEEPDVHQQAEALIFWAQRLAS